MRLSKLFLTLAALAATATQATAQTKNTTEWSTFYVQYNMLNLEAAPSQKDDWGFNAFTVGYDKAISLTSDAPVFLTIGAALQASFYTDDEESYVDNKFSMYSVKVPASLTYKWEASKGITILPFAGIYARYNVSGTLKEEFDSNIDDEKRNLFSKKDKDMGSKDAVWNRLQLGWQIGANVVFSQQWHLGVAYGSDFSEVVKKRSFSHTSFTLGIDF